jgi:TPR repeat protein
MENKNIILKVFKKIIFLIFFLSAIHAHAENQPFSRGEALFGAAKYDEAFPIINEYALQGNPKAQGLVARMYGNGWGIKENPKKAYEFALKGAERDDPSALFVLGYLYETGGFVERNFDESIKWYEKSAKMGNDRADKALARIYDSERDASKRNTNKAFKWLLSSANKGDAYSQRRLAIYYLYILEDDRKDFNEAVKWFLAAIDNGDVSSNILLGKAYQLGLKNIAPDYLKSLKYFEAAFNINKTPENINNLDKTYMHLLSDYYSFSGNNFGEDYIKRLENFYIYLKDINHPRWYSYQAILYELGIDRPLNRQLSIELTLNRIKLELEYMSSDKAIDIYKLDRYSFLTNLRKIEGYFKHKRYPERIFEEPRLGYAWHYYADNFANETYGNSAIKQTEDQIKLFKEYEKEFTDNLTDSEISKYEKLSIDELISETQLFLKNRRLSIGYVEARDMLSEGWLYFKGKNGRQINEPVAHYLTEQALRLAIKNRDKIIESYAQNNLGAIASDSVNPVLKDERISTSLLLQGYDTSYAPNNLLWLNYEKKISLTDSQLIDLKTRYLKALFLPHPSTYIESLSTEIINDSNKFFMALSEFANSEKNVSRKILIKKKQCDIGRSNLLSLSPNLVLKCFKDLLELVEIQKKNRDYNQEYLDILYTYSLVSEINVDINKTRKIINGYYEKGTPNVIDFFNTIYGLNTKSVKDDVLDFTILNNNSITNGKISALVIGNSKYDSKPLKNSMQDAKLFANKLRNLGFNVFSYSNLNKKQFRKAIFDFHSSSKDSELSLFFFSGHGMQIGGVNYLIPTDTNLNGSQEDVTYDGISLSDLMRNNLPGKTKLIFLDACRNNPYKYANEKNVLNKGLSSVNNIPLGTLISFAARDGGIAYDAVNGGGSPYVAALLKHISSEKDITSVLRDVRSEVMKATNNKQEPWDYGSLSSGELILSKIKK